MPYFKAILVDVDGTAVDCEPRNRRVLETIAKNNNAEIRQQDWQVLAGTGDDIIWGWLKDTFPAFTMEKDDFILAAKKGYLTDSFGVNARAGVQDILNHALTRQIKLAAVTNSPEDIAAANLSMAVLDDFFPCRVTRTDVDRAGKNPKPAADAFLMAAVALGVDARDCLVIGDTSNDVLGAKAAGMTVIQYVGDPDQRHDEAQYHAYDGSELVGHVRHLIP